MSTDGPPEMDTFVERVIVDVLDGYWRDEPGSPQALTRWERYREAMLAAEKSPLKDRAHPGHAHALRLDGVLARRAFDPDKTFARCDDGDFDRQAFYKGMYSHLSGRR